MRTHPIAAAARAALFAGLLGAASAGPVSALQLSAGSGSGAAGQTVDIAITSGSTTGLGVLSFTFDVTYNANLVTATDVLESGTLVGTAGWGDAVFNVTTTGSTGRIRVTHAGTTVLSGAGELVRIRFLINPAQLGATASALTMSNVTFNEGSPPGTSTNGTLTINATPIITVSPNTGEVIRTQTLAFSVSGSVTNPVTWSTTDAGIATMSPTGVLTGVAPGEVRVVAVDNAGRRDTTDGVVNVRGMGFTAGSGSTFPNLGVSVPITVTSLAGLGIRAGQFTLTFNGAVLTATGVTAPPGTLLNGWGSVQLGASSGRCTVDFAGSSDLTGSGTLCFVEFAAGANAGSTGLTVTQALFNEVLPAKTTNGSVTVQSIPAISISPDVVTLLAGQTQQFTLGGSPTPPVTWSVLNPAVASISGTGLLTALAGGVTQVRAEDAIGAIDFTTSLTVYDLRVTPDTVIVAPGAVVMLGIESDRDLGSLDVRAVQYLLTWNSPYLTGVAFDDFGLMGVWMPNILGDAATTGQLEIVAAGSAPLASTGRVLHRVRFDVSPSAPDGTNIPITLASLLMNEGTPSPQRGNGLIRVRTVTGVSPALVPAALGMAPPFPNPASGVTRFRIGVPGATGSGPGVLRLAIVGVDGRHVRTLLDGTLPPGVHDLTWDLRDDAGSAVPAGVYWAKLTGDRASVVRRMAVIR
jgi:hypothetical protein